MAFFAIPIPSEIQDLIHKGIAELRHNFGQFQWVDPRDYHLTLRFLGPLKAEDLAMLLTKLKVQPPRIEKFTLTSGAIQIFLPRGGAGVLWLGLESVPAELIQLQSELENVTREPCFPIERKPFIPHITLARFRDQDQLRLDAQLSITESLNLGWTVDSYALMQRRPNLSRDDSQALYEVLHQVSWS